MLRRTRTKSGPEKAADIVRDAGGKVIGRTRLQKIGYFLELAGLGDGFNFTYRHYGPFSEDLADATQIAELFDLLIEEQKPTSWGGTYSIFKTVPKDAERSKADTNLDRVKFIDFLVKQDPVALELAATAAYFAVEKSDDPWGETKKRKPEKAEIGLSEAKKLYKELQKLETPKNLPEI